MTKQTTALITTLLVMLIPGIGHAMGQITFNNSFDYSIGAGSGNSANQQEELAELGIHLSHSLNADAELGSSFAIEGIFTDTVGPNAPALTMTLTNPDGTLQYEGSVLVEDDGYFSFTATAQQAGAYIVEVSWPGDDAYSASDASMVMPLHHPTGMVVLVAGGPTNSPRWQATNSIISYAYMAMRAQGIQSDDIYILHPDEAQLTPHEETTVVNPTRENLNYAISEWAKDKVDVSSRYAPFQTPLTLIIVGDNYSGAPGILEIGHGAEGTLTGAMIDGALDTMLDGINERFAAEIEPLFAFPVRVILESPGAASLMHGISGGSPYRSVLASTGHTGPSYLGANGAYSFTYSLIESSLAGEYLGAAFNSAKQQMINLYGNQVAEVEASGDGFSNQVTDSGLINGLTLAPAPLHQIIPRFQNVQTSQSVPLSEGELELWAEATDLDNGSVTVHCTVYPPTGTKQSTQRVELTQSVNHNDLYSTTYNGFTSPGVYQLVYTATDPSNHVSLYSIHQEVSVTDDVSSPNPN